MLVYVKLVLTAAFWGGTFIAGKMLAGDVTPYSAAFLRFVIASLFLVVLTRIIEGEIPKIPRNKILPVTLLGLTGVFSYNIFFFKGLHYIGAGRASLIIATNPILISCLSALIFKEQLNRIKVAGILMSVCGAILVISRGDPAILFGHGIGTGEVCIFICVLSWVTYSLIGKFVMNELSAITSVCYSSVIGTIALMGPALANGLVRDISSYSAGNWIALVYLGFFGTVLGFFWYYDGIKKIGPMKAGVFINFVPVSALLFSFLILGERITLPTLGGAVLVISGVYVTNFSDFIQTLFHSAGRRHAS